jgi:hypothetical protein
VIEPTATSYGFRVLLKGARKNALIELAGAPDLVAIGREEAVARSFAELRDNQLRILDSLNANGIRAGSSIDLAQNRINVVTRDGARIEQLVAQGTISIPDFAVITDGDPTAVDQATIRGGTNVEGVNYGCQTGFSVRNYSGVRGTVTAAHCEDALTTFSGGVNIGALQQATTTPTQYRQGLDIQWHATTANTYPNQIQYGSTIVSITSTAGVSVMQPNSTEVCVVRWRTQTTSCGRIYSTSYYVDHPTHGRSGPFVGVNPVGPCCSPNPGTAAAPGSSATRPMAFTAAFIRAASRSSRRRTSSTTCPWSCTPPRPEPGPGRPAQADQRR